MEKFNYKKVETNMKKFDLEKFLSDWELYYNDLENDVNKEAVNCITISFSEDDISSLTKNDLKTVLIEVEKFCDVRVTNIQKKMIFYSWIDEMIPAIRFGLVSIIYDTLPFSAKYTEIKDKDMAINYFFDQLKFSSSPILTEALKLTDDKKEDNVDFYAQEIKVYSSCLGSFSIHGN